MLQLIVNIVLKFLASYLQSRQDKVEANQKFLDFVDAMGKAGLTSVKLAQSAESQLDRLKDMKDQINKGVEDPTPLPTVRGLALQTSVKEVKAGEGFEVKILNVPENYALGIHLFAERKHFITSIQPPLFKAIIKLNGTGERTIGFESQKDLWIEAKVNVV